MQFRLLYPIHEEDLMHDITEDAMGRLVDRWLQSLRRHGAGDLEVLAAAKALGTAAANGPLNPDHANQFVRAFCHWVGRE